MMLMSARRRVRLGPYASISASQRGAAALLLHVHVQAAKGARYGEGITGGG